MRQRVGAWGTDLSDDDFACALAAAGLGELGPGDWLRWRWTGVPSAPARELADHWKQFAITRLLPIRVAIDGDDLEAWPFLARAATAIAGLVVAAPAPADARPEAWSWPWPIVDLTADPSLAEVLRASSWRDRTIALVDPPDEREPAGLAIVDGPIAPALERVAQVHRRQRAHAVLVTAPVEGAPEATRAIAHQLGAAIAIAGAPSERGALVRFVERLAIELSHDLPLDGALLVTARDLGMPAPILHADPDLLERARLRNRAAHLVAQLIALRGPGDEKHMSFDAPESGRVPLTELVGRLDWGSEGRGATTVAQLAKAQRARDAQSANKMPPRYLQARVSARGSLAPVTALAPERDYDVMVKIGEFDRALLQVLNPVREPYAGGDVTVDVVISDRAHLPEPLRAQIVLPPNGSSTEATFPLRTRAGARLELRVTVLHRGRVLQSGILRAAVDGADPITFGVDAVARHHLAGLEHRREFDAAFVANHAADGTPGVTGIVPDGVGYVTIDPTHLHELAEAFGTAISEIAIDPTRYEKLDSEGTVTLLRELALRGAAFHRLLVKHTGIGKGLLAAERIQIVAARPNTFLPLELVYELPPPDADAPLCEHAADALRTGACVPACGGRDGSRVCPLGFWALTRVIERHEHRWQPGGIAGDYRLEAAPRATHTETTTPARSVLERPRAVVFAASDRVDAVAEGSLAELRRQLTTTFGEDNVRAAADWKQWVTAVTEAKRPDLLLVLPHHKASPQNDGILEIGASSELRALTVRDDHVTGRPSTPPSPIVILLGCETSMAQLPNESFVSVFRDFEAALVISTISTILGREAAPVAAALAKELIAVHDGGGGFVGEAMVRMRRALLAEGRAMVLAITAYGDADWMLAATTQQT